MKVREPVPRPLDVIAAEVVLTVTQALLTGTLAYLSVGFWAERGVGTGPMVAILAISALALGVAWLYWLLGGEGWPMALACLPVALTMGFLTLLAAQGTLLFDLDLPLALLMLSASLYGIAAGFFLDSPRRWRWDQRRAPRPGAQVPRLSPTTQRVLAMLPRLEARPRLARPARPALRGRSRARPEPAEQDEAPERDADAAAPVAARQPGLRMATPIPTTPRPESARRPQVSARARHDADEEDWQATDPAARRGASGARAGRQGPSIDLPTAEEPSVRRSPWAWASPPEWNRDDLEEEEPSSARRSEG
jgi:hypothetical protein